jgi:hypothetical protein
MSSTRLGLNLKANSCRLMLVSAAGRQLTLELWGYQERLHQLIQICQEERIPVYLNGYLPLDDEAIFLLRQLQDRGVRLWANRSFRSSMRDLYPDTGLEFRGAHQPPPGTYPISVFSLIRDPVWRVLQDLAIPLPRRMAAIVEPPRHGPDQRMLSLGEYFSHFLDSGGLITDLVTGQRRWPRHSLIAALLEIFPQCKVTDPASAAMLGAIRTVGTLRRNGDSGWILIHTGPEVCTVYAIRNSRMRAAFAHYTDRLTADTLNEYIGQLLAGRRFERELLLDGGLFLQTRLLPEDQGPWELILLTGAEADKFSSLPGIRLEKGSRLEWEGLRSLLGKMAPVQIH